MAHDKRRAGKVNAKKTAVYLAVTQEITDEARRRGLTGEEMMALAIERSFHRYRRSGICIIESEYDAGRIIVRNADDPEHIIGIFNSEHEADAAIKRHLEGLTGEYEEAQAHG